MAPSEGVRVFIPKTWRDYASTNEIRRFDEICAALDRLQVEARDAGDPLLFHATTAAGAASILKDGSGSEVRLMGIGGISYGPGLYFGTLSSAVGMSLSRVTSGTPVILAARASTLALSGSLHPDINIVDCGACRVGAAIWPDREDPPGREIFDTELAHMSWEESLHLFGAIACLSDGPIAGLRAISIEGPDPVLAEFDVREDPLRTPSA